MRLYAQTGSSRLGIKMNSEINKENKQAFKKKLLFVLRQAPYGSSLAKEAIDAILASSAYDQALSVAFIDDGVFQLVNSQKAEAIEQKNLASMLAAFPLYDINNLFACQDSLTHRGIQEKDIPKDIQVLNNEQLKTLLQSQEHLLSF